MYQEFIGLYFFSTIFTEHKALSFYIKRFFKRSVEKAFLGYFFNSLNGIPFRTFFDFLVEIENQICNKGNMVCNSRFKKYWPNYCTI